MDTYRPKSFLYRVFSKIPCYLILFAVTPGIYIFEMAVVFPHLVELFETGVAKQIMHATLATFCFMNIVGNMMFSILIDSSLKGPVYGHGTYCEYCRMSRPARSWHCMRCNVCILRRDHHCTYISRCVGLYNQRYYILFLAYVCISMMYATYYNYFYVTSKFEDYGWVLSAFRIVNPFLRVLVPEPMGMRDLYVFYLLSNVGLIIWSFSLFYYHIRNVLMGVTSYESKYPELRTSSKWRENFVNVFGTRWYLAIFWPFCDSPLPDAMKIE